MTVRRSDATRAALVRLLWRSVHDGESCLSGGCTESDLLDVCEAWRALGFGKHWPGHRRAVARLRREARRAKP